MPKSTFDGQAVLVTGGTGSFGGNFVRRLLKDHKPKKVVVFSRDELKQSDLARELDDRRLRFLLGDIRDLPRLQRAFDGIDVVVHSAALKQVPATEYNPFEAVKTNVIGAENIINAAIDNGVRRVVALSTDKAVNPANLYGATKLCMERLFIAGNIYAAGKKTRFCVVRYGNVLGSRGSVLPLYRARRASGRLPITDTRMTRFWITLDQSVDTVVFAAEKMHGGEIFVPKLPSMKMTSLARVLAPECRLDVVGVRPGEKIHEALLTDDEVARTVDVGRCYVVKPLFPWWEKANWNSGRRLPEGFRYTSEAPERLMGDAQMARLLKSLA